MLPCWRGFFRRCCKAEDYKSLSRAPLRQSPRRVKSLDGYSGDTGQRDFRRKESHAWLPALKKMIAVRLYCYCGCVFPLSLERHTPAETQSQDSDAPASPAWEETITKITKARMTAHGIIVSIAITTLIYPKPCPKLPVLSYSKEYGGSHKDARNALKHKHILTRLTSVRCNHQRKHRQHVKENWWNCGVASIPRQFYSSLRTR